MTGTGGAAPPTAVLGLDLGGSWSRGAAQRNPRLLSGSVQPGNRTRAPLRLPSLSRGACRRSGAARLSLSEPSLLSPSQDFLFEGVSGSRGSGVLQKPPSLSKPCRNGGRDPQLQNRSRPAYFHISRPIQPSARPRPARRHSHSPAPGSEVLHGDPRLPQRWSSWSCQVEPLSVVGRPCVLVCSQPPPHPPPPAARTQLHVFLPSEAEGQEVDSESVDEGFMDELDHKISSLKIHQDPPQTVTDHS